MPWRYVAGGVRFPVLLPSLLLLLLLLLLPLPPQIGGLGAKIIDARYYQANPDMETAFYNDIKSIPSPVRVPCYR